ncbi:hypothetical protein ACIRVF_38770 [Kitasatospora sp. NPDC101157]|uniref:hypothetical protein n=1 Tax=Kitasatospora sp. NPDC101157 TaxID=3364098 RepID=UPI0037F90A4B
MALPTWMLTHTDTSKPVPLAALGQLLVWLDSTENRVDWKAARLAREMDLIEAERALDEAQYGREKATAERVVQLRERVAEARGRAGLAALVEELAERTRLRIAATANHPGTDADDSVLRALAVDLNLGIRNLIDALADTEHVHHPAEAHRNAAAALTELTSARRAVEATGAARDLRRWAEAVKLALDVTRLTAIPA